MATPEQVNRVGRVLASAARVAYLERSAIAGHDGLRQLTAEVAGLCDALAGVPLTDPEGRADRHMATIGDLSAGLPVLDRETDR